MDVLFLFNVLKSIGESFQNERPRCGACVQDSSGALAQPAGATQLRDHSTSGFLPPFRRVGHAVERLGETRSLRDRLLVL
jgi:hypothetical protein